MLERRFLVYHTQQCSLWLASDKRETSGGPYSIYASDLVDYQYPIFLAELTLDYVLPRNLDPLDQISLLRLGNWIFGGLEVEQGF